MNTKIESTAQRPQDLLDDLRALVAEAEEMMNDASEQSDAAINALRLRFDAARARFSEIYETARKQVVAGARSVDETIRANPYQSLALAVGTGLVIGLVLSRRPR